MWYDNLNEKAMWGIFEEISRIPRESGNEEGIRKYLLNRAAEHGLSACTDKTGNVFIYVPASKGREKDDPICLQGHMDMVCVKTAESTHDFTRDPIEIVCDGKTVRAKDTSLGGDNGIAIAIALEIAEDGTLEHPPLELLFTVSEETGLTGAFNLDGKKISARRLINLDSEEEGIIYTGCAGGIEIEARAKAKYKDVDRDNVHHFRLEVSGLLGGHSGGEIHKGRANAIKVAARIMHRMPDFSLTALSGGTRRNVIPSACTISFLIDKDDEDTCISIFDQTKQELENEYRKKDPGITLTLTKLDEVPQQALKGKLSLSFMEALYLTPHGPQAMSADFEGIVETSNNLAIVSLDEDGLRMISSTRSLIESARNECAYTVAAVYEDFGFNVRYDGAYPSWEPDISSALVKKTASLYKAFFRKKAVVTTIHAGLECGIINSVIPGMDSISIGPNLFDVHSVNEHLEVDSVERTLSFMKYLLAKL